MWRLQISDFQRRNHLINTIHKYFAHVHEKANTTEQLQAEALENPQEKVQYKQFTDIQINSEGRIKQIPS